MEKHRPLLDRHAFFGLVLAICTALGFALSSAEAATRIPTLDGRGVVTVDAAPGINATPIETPLQHTGDPAATITTSVTPANAPTDIVATPVPHAGGGVVTTRTGPALPSASTNVKGTGKVFAPLAVAPSFDVSASCTADAQGTFTITDTGGDMTAPFTWRLSLNGTAIASNTFQLAAGGSTAIRTAGLFGTLTLDILDTSNVAVASASTFCASPPPPAPPSFSVGASCTADAQGTFTITDTGGNMTVPFTWRLSLNGTAIASNSFQLNAGASTTIHTAGLFGTLTLDILDASDVVLASGTTFCQAPPPPPPPAFTIGASCTADAQGTFTITDTGGSMAVPFSYRLSLNGTPIASNTFQLTAGGSTTIHTAGLFGDLTLDLLDTSGVVVASASTFCPTAPAPTLPAFTVSASCAPDATGVITITDVGGAMTVPFTWHLSLNGTPIATGSFQLTAGQSTTVNTSGIFGTLALDVLDPSNVAIASASMFCPTRQVSVPNVLGMTQAAATTAVTSAGLVVGTVTSTRSATVPAGRVISESPTAGTNVAAGSAVNLVVSSGPLVGDVNGDGVVNCTDLAIVKASFGKTTGQPGFDARADVNHDGVVNIIDLATVAHALPTGTICK